MRQKESELKNSQLPNIQRTIDSRYIAPSYGIVEKGNERRSHKATTVDQDYDTTSNVNYSYISVNDYQEKND